MKFPDTIAGAKLLAGLNEPPEIGPGDIICNRCNGKGVARPIETIFPFRMDVVRNFAEFCEYSGGFLKL